MKWVHTPLRAPGAAIAVWLGLAVATFAAQPYPNSNVVDTIAWRFETHFQHGPGSDQ